MWFVFVAKQRPRKELLLASHANCLLPVLGALRPEVSHALHDDRMAGISPFPVCYSEDSGEVLLVTPERRRHPLRQDVPRLPATQDAVKAGGIATVSLASFPTFSRDRDGFVGALTEVNICKQADRRGH